MKCFVTEEDKAPTNCTDLHILPALLCLTQRLSRLHHKDLFICSPLLHSSLANLLCFPFEFKLQLSMSGMGMKLQGNGQILVWVRKWRDAQGEACRAFPLRLQAQQWHHCNPPSMMSPAQIWPISLPHYGLPGSQFNEATFWVKDNKEVLMEGKCPPMASL